MEPAADPASLPVPGPAPRRTRAPGRGAALGVGLALAAFAAGCSTLEIHADYDRETDFSRYRTFEIRDGARPRDPFTQRRVERALETALTARGLTPAEGRDADLRVFTHFVTHKETRIDTYGYGMGGWYDWRWRGGVRTTRVTKIPIGTIVVDVVDARRKELVWRGTATDEISRDETPRERDAKVKETVEKLLADFPPGRATGS